MKKIAFYLIVISCLSSCNLDNKNDSINSFLITNFDFNTRNLNTKKAYYTQLSIEQPNEYGSFKLNDTIYKAIQRKLDNSINQNKKVSDSLLLEYQKFIDYLETAVEADKTYMIDDNMIISDDLKNNSETHVLILKNNLAISMSYAYEYLTRYRTYIDGIHVLDHIDTKAIVNNANNTEIILSSEIAQHNPYNRHVLVDQLTSNRKKVDLKYDSVGDFSFYKITLDSLENGIYSLKGRVKYYNRDGEFEVPFSQEFEVKQ
ncbi:MULTISPECIES: hypothetical protein [Nonlabens]|uniref:hypothetical protein n=1 Tax=Nonlabens TaxID=363408 RepID=UPI003266F321